MILWVFNTFSSFLLFCCVYSFHLKIKGNQYVFSLHSFQLYNWISSSHTFHHILFTFADLLKYLLSNCLPYADPLVLAIPSELEWCVVHRRPHRALAMVPVAHGAIVYLDWVDATCRLVPPDRFVSVPLWSTTQSPMQSTWGSHFQRRLCWWLLPLQLRHFSCCSLLESLRWCEKVREVRKWVKKKRKKNNSIYVKK